MIPVRNKPISYREARTSGKNYNRRKIRKPYGDLYGHLNRKYRNQVTRGEFLNDTYADVKMINKLFVLIKAFIIYIVPAIIIHMAIAGLMGIATYFSGEHQPIPIGGWNVIIPMYIFGVLMALWRIHDNMAHYNRVVISDKHNINRCAEYLYVNTDDPKQTPEIKAIDKYRRRYNKFVLFPTRKEMIVTEQNIERAAREKTDETDDRQLMLNIRNNHSLENIKAEHRSAKRIADMKQNLYGGLNEYDMMVRRYKHRTTKEVKNALKHI